MPGSAMDKLIIEVLVNEYMMRDVNPHVPWTADELACDAAAIEAAGANMLRFHARRPDDSPAHDPPTAAGLRTSAEYLPDRPIQWAVCSKPGNLFPNAATAIQQGGHASIGIGDHTYAEMGNPTNADLVRRVVALTKSCGREVAIPDEARRMLGVTR